MLGEFVPIPFSEPRRLPTAAGVYVVTRDASVLYVGQAHNLRRRWHGHHRARQLRGLRAELIHWWACPPDELDGWEQELIELLQPRLNGRDIPPPPPSPEKLTRAAAFMRHFVSDWEVGS